VYRGDNRPPSKCDDVPVPFEVANVENETNKAIVVGEGTCALKGPVTDANIDPGADENISPTDIWISG
jgi:Ni,Fe-hydrogenase III small subunit